MFIYCIENTITGKKYVGKTVKSIEQRFQRHIISALNGSNTYLHRAIRKYGTDNFKVSMLEEISEKQLLSEKEIEWITKLNTQNEGYNLTAGGEGSLNRKYSNETKTKISEALKNIYFDPQKRKEHSIATKSGMKKWWNDLSEDQKQKWIEACKKRPEGYISPSGFTYTHTEEAKIAIANANRGKKYSLEIKKKISNSRKGKGMGSNNAMANPENRAKVAQSKIGRKRVYMPDGSFKYMFPENIGG